MSASDRQFHIFPILNSAIIIERELKNTANHYRRLSNLPEIENASAGEDASTESGRKTRMERAEKGSMWMSLVATPSVKDGFAGATGSSRREVTPKGLPAPGSAARARVCSLYLRLYLKKMLYSFTTMLGIPIERERETG